ncbi:MAG: cobyric acid synthase [Dehalococcoidia bacterium]|nr:cobyric acid synthase [Dehalococcoidia bacterium]
MTAKTLMVQGTASSVGKSVLVAALCRIFKEDGLRVAPFKAQNMALNSYVTPDGLEVGRAQAMQAEAAGVPVSIEMNPILLKPETDARSQLVVWGRPAGSYAAVEYFQRKLELWPVVVEALERLRSRFDLVVMEGAGSPAEVNLRESDIVNMRVARHAGAPVLLVGDIDRGGVFASLVGTLELLEPQDRGAVRGLVINKFRGDLALLQPGLDFLEQRTALPVLGVIPYLPHLRLAEEDSVALEALSSQRPQDAAGDRGLDIAVIRLPHIANYDEFDGLAAEPGVRVRFPQALEELGTPDLLVLPGTKTTVADLLSLRTSGLADAILALVRGGTPVLGICGGYQMLGQRLLDPDGVESPRTDVPGLGLLPVVTTFACEKRTERVRAAIVGGLAPYPGPVPGYEIHMGRTLRPDRSGSGQAPGDPDVSGFARVTERLGRPCADPDGACTPDGGIAGTYVHGLLEDAGYRAAFLEALAVRRGVPWQRRPAGPDAGGLDRQAEYARLAAAVRASLDMGRVYQMLALKGSPEGARTPRDMER